MSDQTKNTCRPLCLIAFVCSAVALILGLWPQFLRPNSKPPSQLHDLTPLINLQEFWLASMQQPMMDGEKLKQLSSTLEQSTIPSRDTAIECVKKAASAHLTQRQKCSIAMFRHINYLQKSNEQLWATMTAGRGK